MLDMIHCSYSLMHLINCSFLSRLNFNFMIFLSWRFLDPRPRQILRIEEEMKNPQFAHKICLASLQRGHCSSKAVMSLAEERRDNAIVEFRPRLGCGEIKGTSVFWEDLVDAGGPLQWWRRQRTATIGTRLYGLWPMATVGRKKKKRCRHSGAHAEREERSVTAKFFSLMLNRPFNRLLDFCLWSRWLKRFLELKGGKKGSKNMNQYNPSLPEQIRRQFSIKTVAFFQPALPSGAVSRERAHLIWKTFCLFFFLFTSPSFMSSSSTFWQLVVFSLSSYKMFSTPAALGDICPFASQGPSPCFVLFSFLSLYFVRFLFPLGGR